VGRVGELGFEFFGLFYREDCWMLVERVLNVVFF